MVLLMPSLTWGGRPPGTSKGKFVSLKQEQQQKRKEDLETGLFVAVKKLKKKKKGDEYVIRVHDESRL